MQWTCPECGTANDGDIMRCACGCEFYEDSHTNPAHDQNQRMPNSIAARRFNVGFLLLSGVVSSLGLALVLGLIRPIIGYLLFKNSASVIPEYAASALALAKLGSIYGAPVGLFSYTFAFVRKAFGIQECTVWHALSLPKYFAVTAFLSILWVLGGLTLLAGRLPDDTVLLVFGVIALVIGWEFGRSVANRM